MQVPAGAGKSFAPIFGEIVIIAILTGLYLIGLANYLLFHSIVEIISIAVALAIFLIIWNARKDLPDAFYLIIGISLLFIGIIDLVHMLAFKGMGVFAGDTSDLATQLWIAGRYFQGIAFLAATAFIGRSITKDRKYDVPVIIAAGTAGSVLIFASIFLWQNFPACFVEGIGLTPFKIVSEYIISFILIATIILLYLKRDHFSPTVWQLLVGAQVFLILSELTFTSYISVYGPMNLLGHLFRLLSVYFFYRAFVVIALTEPYDLLLREQKKSERELNERVKELGCMFSISTLIETPGVSLPEICEKSVLLLPQAMQYAEIARARIRVEGKLYETDGFRETPWTLAQEVRVSGAPVGRVEVGYLKERPKDFEGPFLREERYLVNAVAVRLGMVIERDRAEKALVTSERQYRSFVQSFRGIAYLATADWVPVFFHGAVAEITGYSENDFITGKPRWDQVIHPDDLALIQERDNLRLLNEPGFSTLREYRIIRKDGEIRWVSDFIQNWTDESGHLFFSGVLMDITGRKRTEEALRESEEKYRSIIEHIEDGYFRIDPENRIEMASPSAVRMFGYSSMTEMLGMPVQSLWKDHGKRTEFLENMRTSGGAVQDWETEFVKKDGSALWVSLSAHLRPGEHGEYRGTEGIVRDISERKRMEESLVMANRKLHLLSSITRHDIKNQLLALGGYIDLSKTSIERPETLREFFSKEEKIARAIDRQISFTKDYEGLGVKSPVWQDAWGVATSAAASLPLQNIQYLLDLPPVEIYADPLFEKVFYNLIDNSLHYAGPKMTMIRITAQQAGDLLEIIYEDDGEGIGLADKKRLFTKGFGKHTGLGLFLSREILGITGITIAENGEPGKGVRFVITVPRGGFRFTGTS